MLTSDSQGIDAGSLTTGERIYCAIVILCAGFLLVTLAMFHFFIIPGSDDPGIFYFLVALIWLEVLTIIVTVALNLHFRKLLLIPTILQCAVLCLTVYFIPIAIWGAVLLYRQSQRIKTVA